LADFAIRMPHMQKVSYNVLRDFTWIICLTGYVGGLVVRSDTNLRSLRDFIDFAKAHPRRISVATPGQSTTMHVALLEFARQAGIEFTYVPFRGAAEVLPALLGAHVTAAMASSAWAPHVKSGALRLLATYGSTRTRRWPSVPTLQESGFRIAFDAPYGICGPAGIEEAVTRRIHDAFRSSLADEAVQACLEALDQPVVYMDTATYTDWAAQEYERERRLVTQLGLKAAE
jgi:tripartite-type tricarboxylate transporter receptor subunit TctC